MEHSVFFRILAGSILLLALAGTAAAESSTITDISPAVSYTGSTTTVTITGTDFNTSSVKVRLMMDDETNITATIVSHTENTIKCKFTISSSKETGDWDLVVINEDGSEAVVTEGFTIRAPMTLSSISPSDARANNESVDVTVEGTGLSEVTGLYLYNEDYDNVTATLDDVESEEITATFDLTGTTDDTYDVCVEDDVGTIKCGLTFEITTDDVGSIEISSDPSGAAIYVDGTLRGTTPDTVGDLAEGYHKVVLRMSGYTDWGKMISVEAGEESTVDADLDSITTAPTTVRTPEPTPVRTSPPATARTTTRSTITVPTSWETAATTQEAPADPAVIIGAAGIGLCLAILRKH